ncbi:MAG: acyl-CoA dehydrogenase family protein [Planctomycetota bacterium]|nr:acyl-CoA dehydrogenase family protein [Planctomycetota bacterium]MEC8506413.1 acyl-CoA dehydrogenase family protein [Planctomycetota bacterium]
MIDTPDAPAFQTLSQRLVELGKTLDRPDAWPREQLTECGRAGVYRWFHSPDWGGLDWSPVDRIKGYMQLSAACLTTTFVITQRTGACQRIERSENEALKTRLLPDLVSGKSFATVGISHLTTSRQHIGRPTLRAQEVAGGFELEGFSPWVTGVPFAEHVVIGATLADGRQILAALPTQLDGVSIPATPELVGLSGSQTGRLECDKVFLSNEFLLYGPDENVMKQGTGGNTGGLQTSTLALGLARGAIDFLSQQAESRELLTDPAVSLEAEWNQCADRLYAMAGGESPCTSEELRQQANRLALNATQSALTAAKGTGYLVGHPAGRWCREALFFLVWSCPQPVAQAHLCELAGLS